MPRTPVLFVSHGSPMFALDPGTTGPALSAWVQAHAPAPRLQGIVIMSPHWMTRGIGVMSTPEPETWHDFGGFPEALYQLQYPAKGDPELAQRVLALLQAEPGLVVGDNEPYAVSDATDYSIPVHAEQRGLLHVEIEIRQDLIEDASGQAAWAERLARLLPVAASC